MGMFVVQCGDEIPTIAFGRFFSEVHILTKPQCGSWVTTTSLTKRESGSKIVDPGSVVRDGPDKLSPQCKGGVGSCLGSLCDRSCNPPKLFGKKIPGYYEELVVLRRVCGGVGFGAASPME